MLTRLARIADQDAALEFVKIDAQLYAMFAARRQLDSCGAAKRGWVMILSARWNVDDDRFGVTADVYPINLALPCPGIAIERRADSHSHCTRTPDARAVRSFRIGRQREAALRL